MTALVILGMVFWLFMSSAVYRLCQIRWKYEMGDVDRWFFSSWAGLFWPLTLTVFAGIGITNFFVEE